MTDTEKALKSWMKENSFQLNHETYQLLQNEKVDSVKMFKYFTLKDIDDMAEKIKIPFIDIGQLKLALQSLTVHSELEIKQNDDISNEINILQQKTGDIDVNNTKHRINENKENIEMAITSDPKVLSNSINNDVITADIDNADASNQRQIYDKEHIIWIVTFCLAVYDYFTDIKVGTAWLKISEICPQFKCARIYTDPQGRPISIMYAHWLIICSSIGFFIALILKCIDLKSLIQIFKYPMSQKEVEQIGWKRFLRWSWTALFIEDVVSVFLMWTNFRATLIGSMVTVEVVAIFTSLFSILVTTFVSFYKRYKLSKCKAEVSATTIQCHEIWCVLIGIFWVAMVANLIMGWVWTWQYDLGPLIDISGNKGRLYDDNGNGEKMCNAYTIHENDPYTVGRNGSYIGNLTEIPVLMYENCYGIDYEYDLLCIENGVEVIQLNCMLNWEYKYMMDNESHCHNNGDFCTFDVELGTCTDYAINCNNEFQFDNDSNPITWICFGYC